MKERPIGHLVDALRQAGADIAYKENEGYPPLQISANGLVGGDIEINGDISSQFLTAILLASPMAKEDTTITIVGELLVAPMEVEDKTLTDNTTVLLVSPIPICHKINKRTRIR